MSSQPEPIDLADTAFGDLIQPCEAIPPGEVWTRPAGFELADAIRAFGPGTTAGGRAEAGWRMVGRIVGDGPTFTPDFAP